MRTREDVLVAAAEAVRRSEERYGEPGELFFTIAKYWNTHLQHRYGVDTNLDAADVAAMMVLLKMARFGACVTHEDTAVDMAGYAACAGEVAALIGNGGYD